MSYTVLEKTKGLKYEASNVRNISVYIPRDIAPAPDYFDKPEVTYYPDTGYYESWGRLFMSYEALEGWYMSILNQQIRGSFGTGYDASNLSFLSPVDLAFNPDFVSQTLQIQAAEQSAFVAENIRGMITVASQPYSVSHYSSGSVVTYSPPIGSGIDMSNYNDQLRAEAQSIYVSSW